MDRIEETKALLKKHHLSVTDSRVRILDMFLGAEDALSHSDIESGVGKPFDRVTVYRTLQSFAEKGLIHTIPTPDNTVLYALCKEPCDEQHHADNHIHFICNTCGRTICMDDVQIPPISLPQGFRQGEVQVIVTGTCRQCTR